MTSWTSSITSFWRQTHTGQCIFVSANVRVRARSFFRRLAAAEGTSLSPACHSILTMPFPQHYKEASSKQSVLVHMKDWAWEKWSEEIFQLNSSETRRHFVGQEVDSLLVSFSRLSHELTHSCHEQVRNETSSLTKATGAFLIKEFKRFCSIKILK